MRRSTVSDSGFTLVEVMVAMILLAVGALGLVAAITVSARQLIGNQDQIIATQRAAEAAESVFKARDNRILAWAQIRNVVGIAGDGGGIFRDGAQPVRDPGPDGIVNTADDGAVVNVVRPGPDNLLGTADDQLTPLAGFSREIEIRSVGPNLRQLRVIIRYPSAHGTRTYVLTTMLSSYA